MSAVKQWAFAICATMIATGLAHMLLPKSNMEKMFRTVTSIFFLCAILSPVVLRGPELAVAIPQEAQTEMEKRGRAVEQIADRQALELTEQNISRIVAANLSQRGIKVHEVTINITTDNQNVPLLEEAEIVLAAQHESEHDNIAAQLETDLGCMVRISYR